VKLSLLRNSAFIVSKSTLEVACDSLLALSIVILVVNWLLRRDVEVDFITNIRATTLCSTFSIVVVKVHPLDKAVK